MTFNGDSKMNVDLILPGASFCRFSKIIKFCFFAGNGILTSYLYLLQIFHIICFSKTISN